jgi:hypothetical protein
MARMSDSSQTWEPTPFDHGFQQGQEATSKEAAALLFGLTKSFEDEIKHIRDHVAPRPLVKFRAHCDRLLWSISKLKTGYEILAGKGQLTAATAAHNQAIELALQVIRSAPAYAAPHNIELMVLPLLLPAEETK